MKFAPLMISQPGFISVWAKLDEEKIKAGRLQIRLAESSQSA
jgi:hypothetical protein